MVKKTILFLHTLFMVFFLTGCFQSSDSIEIIVYKDIDASDIIYQNWNVDKPIQLTRDGETFVVAFEGEQKYLKKLKESGVEWKQPIEKNHRFISEDGLLVNHFEDAISYLTRFNEKGEIVWSIENVGEVYRHEIKDDTLILISRDSKRIIKVNLKTSDYLIFDMPLEYNFYNYYRTINNHSIIIYSHGNNYCYYFYDEKGIYLNRTSLHDSKYYLFDHGVLIYTNDEILRYDESGNQLYSKSYKDIKHLTHDDKSLYFTIQTEWGNDRARTLISCDIDSGLTKYSLNFDYVTFLYLINDGSILVHHTNDMMEQPMFSLYDRDGKQTLALDERYGFRYNDLDGNLIFTYREIQTGIDSALLGLQKYSSSGELLGSFGPIVHQGDDEVQKIPQGYWFYVNNYTYILNEDLEKVMEIGPFKYLMPLYEFEDHSRVFAGYVRESEELHILTVGSDGRILGDESITGSNATTFQKEFEEGFYLYDNTIDRLYMFNKKGKKLWEETMEQPEFDDKGNIYYSVNTEDGINLIKKNHKFETIEEHFLEGSRDYARIEPLSTGHWIISAYQKTTTSWNNAVQVIVLDKKGEVLVAGELYTRFNTEEQDNFYIKDRDNHLVRIKVGH